MRRLNILQISSSLGWGGREMYPITLSQKLLERGHNLNLIAHPEGNILKRAVPAKIPTIPMNIHKYIDIKSIFTLSRIIKRENIEIIHSHFATDLWIIVPAAILSGINPAVILTRHMKSHRNKKDIGHRLIYNYVSKVIANSELVKECLLESHPLTQDKIPVIYYGLDLTKYDPGRYNGMQIKQEFNIDNKTKVVGIVGRLDPGKGQEYFLQSAKLILNSYPEIILLIVGEDIGAEGYKNYLINLAQELGISEKVIFTGQRDDIPEVMAALDVFVFTSKAEAFGLVLIEAMAMCKPIVGFRTGAIEEIVEDGINGILIPFGDVTALADKILDLLMDTQKAMNMGKEGRRITEEKFDLDQAGTQTIKLYEEVLSD
ncbi:MAG: glycosyltransferase family 4 protein [bacterium]